MSQPPYPSSSSTPPTAPSGGGPQQPQMPPATNQQYPPQQQQQQQFQPPPPQYSSSVGHHSSPSSNINHLANDVNRMSLNSSPRNQHYAPPQQQQHHQQAPYQQQQQQQYQHYAPPQQQQQAQYQQPPHQTAPPQQQYQQQQQQNYAASSTPQYPQSSAPHYRGVHMPPPSQNQHQQGTHPSAGMPQGPAATFQPNQQLSYHHQQYQAREKIDPSQIPHPVTGEPEPLLTFHTTQGIPNAQQNQHQHFNQPLASTQGSSNSIGLRLPFANQRFRVVDGGSCSPIFMRSTLQKIPRHSSELKNTGLPFGVCISPLADVRPYDQPNFVPQVDFGEQGPVRCTRCQAYINSFVSFVDNGKNYNCNMCGMLNSVPDWYQCALDGFGRRRDIQQRPELTHGSVDYVANKSFHIREPKPLIFIFAIDVSTGATSQGLVSSVVNGLKQKIPVLAKSHPQCRVAFLTFARSVHFYNLHGANPRVMQMGDIDNMSIPCPTTQISISLEKLSQDLSILDAMLDLAKYVSENDNSCGAALDAAKMILGNGGGRVFLFTSKVPNVGTGHIKARDDFKLHGGKKEGVLFQPLLGHWQKKAKEFAKESICVDCFLFPTNSFVESGTFGEVCAQTNGQMHVYDRFDPTRDAERLVADVERHMTRTSGYDAVARVRCSPGLSVASYTGHYFKQNDQDMDLAGVDADSSFIANINYDGTLKDNQPAYIQCAMVYTDLYGRRLIRVHTLRVEVADQIQSVFKFSDSSAVLAVVTREVMAKFQNLKAVRNLMVHRTIEILSKYRKHCSPENSSAQLILPEALKLIPVYLLGLSKSSAFRYGTNVPIDERVWHTHTLMRSSPARIMQYSYPDLYALHQMPPVVQDEEGEYPLPPRLPASCREIEKSGIYLVDDGINLFFWVGSGVNQEQVQSLFTASDVQSVTLDTRVRPDAETELGARVIKILNYLRRGRANHGSVRVFKEQDAADALFFSHLIEDRYASQRSYSEHLCYLHQEISNKL